MLWRNTVALCASVDVNDNCFAFEQILTAAVLYRNNTHVQQQVLYAEFYQK